MEEPEKLRLSEQDTISVPTSNNVTENGASDKEFKNTAPHVPPITIHSVAGSGNQVPMWSITTSTAAASPPSPSPRNQTPPPPITITLSTHPPRVTSSPPKARDNTLSIAKEASDYHPHPRIVLKLPKEAATGLAALDALDNNTVTSENSNLTYQSESLTNDNDSLLHHPLASNENSSCTTFSTSIGLPPMSSLTFDSNSSTPTTTTESGRKRKYVRRALDPTLSTPLRERLHRRAKDYKLDVDDAVAMEGMDIVIDTPPAKRGRKPGHTQLQLQLEFPANNSSPVAATAAETLPAINGDAIAALATVMPEKPPPAKRGRKPGFKLNRPPKTPSETPGQAGDETPKVKRGRKKKEKRVVKKVSTPKTPSTFQVLEEDTRMSMGGGVKNFTSMLDTPTQFSAKSNHSNSFASPSVNLMGVEETSDSTNTSVKQKKLSRMEVFDPNHVSITAEQLYEYQWPPGDSSAEYYLLQEQVSAYLGLKLHRRYPELKRRSLELIERTYLKEKGVVSEVTCDLGLTAIPSREVLDILFNDFPDKYEEYQRVVHERKEQAAKAKQKAALAAEKAKPMDPRTRAIKSCSTWNVAFNRERKDERRYCIDTQTWIIHGPRKVVTKPRPVDDNRFYPVALIPGQYIDGFRKYTPAELRRLPVNTVTRAPWSNSKEEEDGDLSDAESDKSASNSDSSSSPDSSSDSSDDSSSSSDESQEEEQQKASCTERKSANDFQSCGLMCKMCGKGLNQASTFNESETSPCSFCRASGS